MPRPLLPVLEMDAQPLRVYTKVRMAMEVKEGEREVEGLELSLPSPPIN